MKSAMDLIAIVYLHIKKEGEKTHTATSRWGADTYKLGGLTAMLCDEGATIVVKSDGLNVCQSMKNDPVFYDGDENDLLRVATSLGLIE